MRGIRAVAALAAAIVPAASFAAAAPAAPLTCARDVARAAFYEPCVTNRLPFRFTGRITYVRDAHDFDSRILAVEDGTGAVTVTCPSDNPTCAALSPGDTAELAGVVWKHATVKLSECRAISPGPPAAPIDASIEDILDGRHDFRLTRFTGTLRDVAKSETASRWLMLVVCSRRDRIYISVPDMAGARKRLMALLGRKISATGVCMPQDPSRRLRVGRTFKVADDSAISLAETEESETVPDISGIRFARPSEILSLGRHSATGRVIAVWQGSRALLRMANREVVGMELACDVSAPRYGDMIKAVGLPESDLFRINLSNVSWTRLDAPAFAAPEPEPVSARSICTNAFGYKLVKSGYHGRFVSLRGVVRSMPDDNVPQMHVECDGLLVPVDASSLPGTLDGVDIGCVLKLSGTCVVTQEKSRQSAAFPRMDGFTLVLRKPSDMVVVSRPPWWTPRRLMAVIGGLLAVLFGVVVRNMAQRRNAARLSKLATDLKVEERTRLAVELHDSLAQNLTGVSLEIDTADRLADGNPAEMREHLGNAARSLKSCRDELRNCLWDLRNRALEAKSLDDAIRQTIAPHTIGVDVALRFNVPRERISDNTTHAILRIIRELAVNAVRHGKATKLRIAGGIDGDTLLFSVRDNGSGFDPATAPGFAEGHYGLVGITERVETLEGEFSMCSAPGKGAKATVKIELGQSSRGKRQ